MPGVALQLYTLRDQAAADFPGTLRTVARLGYRHVELAGLHGTSPQEARGLLDEAGLQAASAHIPFERFDEDPAGAVAELVALGCSYAVVPSLPAPFQPVDRVAEVARLFGGWGARCADAGVRFAYHNHDFELRVRGDRGATLLELLMAATEPELVAFELDVLWVHVGGGDPRALLERYAERIRLLHVKDAGAAGGDAPFGEGSLPWDDLLPAAEAAGVEWYIVEQDEPQDPLRDVETSLKNLQARLKA